jgi:hypothetical protein
MLKLDGKPFTERPLTPTQSKIKALLDKAPIDEIYSAAELARKLQAPINTIIDQGGKVPDSLVSYTARTGKSRYWGNPKAIAEFLRMAKI